MEKCIQNFFSKKKFDADKEKKITKPREEYQRQGQAIYIMIYE